MKIKITLFFLMFQLSVSAQQKAFGVWQFINLQKKFENGFSVNFKEQIRFNNNASQHQQTYFDIGLGYKILKGLDVGFNYRYTLKNQREYYSNGHKIYGFAQYSQKFGKFKLSYRIMLRSKYESIYSSSEGKNALLYLRNRIMLKYELNKFMDLYAGDEIYNDLNNPKGRQSWSQQKYINRNRLFAGAIYHLSKQASLQAFYLIQKKMNVNDPLTSYVLGIGLNYDF